MNVLTDSDEAIIMRVNYAGNYDWLVTYDDNHPETTSKRFPMEVTDNDEYVVTTVEDTDSDNLTNLLFLDVADGSLEKSFTVENEGNQVHFSVAPGSDRIFILTTEFNSPVNRPTIL